MLTINCCHPIKQWGLLIISALSLAGSTGSSNYCLWLLIPAVLALVACHDHNKKISTGKMVVFFVCYTAGANFWLIKLTLTSTNFSYTTILLLILIGISLQQTLMGIFISRCSNILQRRWLISIYAPAILIFSITAIDYVNSIIFIDWYIINSFLENNYIQKLTRGTITLLGGLNVQFLLLLLTINVAYSIKVCRLKRGLWSLIAAIMLVLGLEAGWKTLHQPSLTLPPLRINLMPTAAANLEPAVEWQHYKNLLQQDWQQDLIILPESAYNGFIEYSEEIPEILNNLLQKDQGLLLGSDRRAIHNMGWNNLNSAYLFIHQTAYFQISSKKYLIPAGEYIPWPLNLFFTHLVNNKQKFYSRGQPEILQFENYRLAAGLCIEGILAGWYRQISAAKPDAYIILAREYLIPKSIQQKADRILALRMLETGKNWAKIAGGGSRIINNLSAPNPADSFTGQLTMNSNFINSYSYFYYWPIIWLVSLLLVSGYKSNNKPQ